MEPWNTFVSHPCFVRGWDYFFTFPNNPEDIRYSPLTYLISYRLYLVSITLEENIMSEEILYTFENPEYRKTFWHTSSHVMAQAVKRLWPEVQLAIGPAIDEDRKSVV